MRPTREKSDWPGNRPHPLPRSVEGLAELPDYYVMPLAATMLALCAYGLQDSLGSDLRTALPIYVIGLFALCMFLHGEMARLRPAAALRIRRRFGQEPTSATASRTSKACLPGLATP